MNELNESMRTRCPALGMLCWVAALIATGPAVAESTGLIIELDASRVQGTIRDVFGTNKKPSFDGRTLGTSVNAASLYSAFGMSQVRLHDAGVDLCAIYTPASKLNVGVMPAQPVTGCELSGTGSVPHFSWTPTSSADADLNNTANYNFTAMDRVLAEVAGTGASVYLRLGESFNGPNDTSDPVAWAKVATNLYKHAIGVFKPTPGIAIDPVFVEVFNEPDGGFWRGSSNTFYTLFTETVTRVRAAAAAAGRTIRIGGPGFTRNILTSSTVAGNPANGFIGAVGVNNLDFYSAHLYNSCSTATLASAGTFLRSLRSLVDAQGGIGKPIHITEWNIGLGSQCGNDLFAEPRTQSFASGVLSLMQDPALNIEAAHQYAAVTIMSLFDFTSVTGKARINPSAWAFWAHARLRGAQRVATKVCQGSTCADGFASDTLPLMAIGALRAGGQTVVVTNDSTGNQAYTLRIKGLSGTQTTLLLNQPPSGAIDIATSGSPAAVGSAGLQSLKSAISLSTPTGLPVNDGTASVTLTIPARSVQLIELSPTQPSVGQRADCVFAWAEQSYPDLLSPMSLISVTTGDYLYRYYAGTGNYLGVQVSNQHLLFLNTRTNPGLVDLGRLADWLGPSGCPGND